MAYRAVGYLAPICASSAPPSLTAPPSSSPSGSGALPRQSQVQYRLKLVSPGTFRCQGGGCLAPKGGGILRGGTGPQGGGAYVGRQKQFRLRQLRTAPSPMQCIIKIVSGDGDGLAVPEGSARRVRALRLQFASPRTMEGGKHLLPDRGGGYLGGDTGLLEGGDAYSTV